MDEINKYIELVKVHGNDQGAIQQYFPHKTVKMCTNFWAANKKRYNLHDYVP